MSVDKSKVLIQVQDLKKAFGSNQVLDGISTDICQGEVVAIIGPSGSGKSTFLRSLNLLEEPTGGKILFEGTDITDPKVDINRHRQKIGMVFQQFNLFPHKTVCLLYTSSCIIKSIIRICDYYHYNSGSRTGSMALSGGRRGCQGGSS